jgi:hypothetical protein
VPLYPPAERLSDTIAPTRDLAKPADRVSFARQIRLDVAAALLLILNLADYVDRLLYGYRLLVIVLMAGLVAVTSFFDDDFGDALAVGFLLFAVTLLYSRVGAFRSGDGQWHARHALRRCREGFDAIAASTRASLKGIGILATLGRVIFCAAVVASAVRHLLRVATEAVGASVLPGLANSLNDFAILGTVVGALLWLIGWHVRRHSGVVHHLLITPGHEAALLSAASAMPLLIDAGDDVALRKAASTASHPLLKQLLEVFGEWREPRTLRDEGRYQASLHRLLSSRLAEAKPEREVTIGSRANRNDGRADLVVGQAVLIDMKRGWGASTVDRAVGQLRRYATLWSGRGPIVLVLCDVEPALVGPRLSDELVELRQKIPCFAVIAAGPRARR